ncbi:hypothetical protein, partial [Enterobacter hormaechei]|uniref:hypothetical protein n=1 Tax=Enterobacter hormaechei TaxID=158836 RepID=UPI001CAA864A
SDFAIFILFFCFYILFRGYLFYQLGPGPTEPSNAETKGFTKKNTSSLHFTFVAFFLSRLRVKEVSWFTFSFTCIGTIFFWLVLHFVDFVDLRLYARCQSSQLLGIRYWLLRIWTPTQNRGGD